MANDKKKSKGPQHRNGNYQMKNGNAVSKKHEKKQDNAGQSVDTKSGTTAKPEGQKSLISGISGSITSATNSITRMFKNGQ
jgi:hypothetical protein